MVPEKKAPPTAELAIDLRLPGTVTDEEFFAETSRYGPASAPADSPSFYGARKSTSRWIVMRVFDGLRR